MSAVIQLPRCPARAQGAAAAVSAAATRYGHNLQAAKSYGAAAEQMVHNGHSAARAIEAVRRRARSEAPKPNTE
jgi:hypothetical protein